MARACRSTTARARSRSRNGWRTPTSPTCWRCHTRQAAPATPPAKDVDPGRARNAAFFDKVYGNCRDGEVEKNLGIVAWLPKKTKQRLPFSKVNGAARALAAVSAELEALPASFDVFLFPSAGTLTAASSPAPTRVSAHGQGIAIDIA